LGQFFDPSGLFHNHLANTYGRVAKINGMFGDKNLHIFDPKAVHHILIQEHDIYEELPAYIECNRIVFGLGLLSTIGEHHRKQRRLINPAFSTVHLRDIVPTFFNIAHKLQDVLTSKLKDGPLEIDMLAWSARISLEAIGQSGLGYSFDSFNERSVNPYAAAVKTLLPTLHSLSVHMQLLPLLVKITPTNFRSWLAKIAPSKRVQKIRDIVNIMDQTSVEVFKAKKVALQQDDDGLSKDFGKGKDIMTILLKANMDAAPESRLGETELIGQVTTLIFAAMDTTSSGLGRILHLLAQHPVIQHKLRTEITEAQEGKGDLDYNGLTTLPYLDAVCRETLRLYPPFIFVMRRTLKNSVLPLSTPIKGVDGREIHDILVPANTDVYVSLQGANRDPLIWGSDALVWKPERWLSPLPPSVRELPGAYANSMTFLCGVRACIGLKFAPLEIKVILLVLLQYFNFELSDQEITWRMGTFASPSLKDGTTALPLKVSVVGSG
jgi:cytochrome P450